MYKIHHSFDKIPKLSIYNINSIILIKINRLQSLQDFKDKSYDYDHHKQMTSSPAARISTLKS